jgi:hypothetical protein
MERFNLKKLNNVEVKNKYQVKISNGFAALENVSGAGGDDDDLDINRAWKNVRI